LRSERRVRAVESVGHLARQLVEGCHDVLASGAVGATCVAAGALGSVHSLRPRRCRACRRGCGVLRSASKEPNRRRRGRSCYCALGGEALPCGARR
jgi:hypothetical protein